MQYPHPKRKKDEQESMALYAEHMVEVGQYLKKKLADRAEKNGRQVCFVRNLKLVLSDRKTDWLDGERLCLNAIPPFGCNSKT